VDEQGQLRAINPERGFFGVAPNTSDKTNPNAMAMIRSNTIFTNVALTPSGEPWWEGIGSEPPNGLLDWQGRPWRGESAAAHPNSRFTVAANQCPSISPRWEDPHGVPISALIFGSRRTHVAPLVFEGFNWQHGVYLGASMGAETTAAATGKVGVVRIDPMAMLPFCGYNMADYFSHWLEIGKRMTAPPKIFRVNWFRRDAAGKFLWPGYGENVRVLRWIIERTRGTARAVESPIGWLPTSDALDLNGLSVPKSRVDAALTYERDGWLEDLAEQRAFFARFGERLPSAIWEEHERTGWRLAK
jgi:phosphoenolpyruvate carboxykinase (GTP)